MIIPINLSDSGTSTSPAHSLPPQFAQFGTDEVVLIELQGSLDVEGNKEGQVVGKLSIDDNTKKPTLLIGHHLLEGKLVNLPKPLAVLRRQPRKIEGVVGDGEDVQVGDESAVEDDPSKGQREWNVVTIVKRKMVFSKRPMPIVGRPAAPVSSSGKDT